MTTGYNGWTNYETWSVALIIDNDQGSYDYARELAQKAWDETAHLDTEDREPEAVYNLTDNLREWVTSPLDEGGLIEDRPEVIGYLGSQLMGAALSEVNWREIADHYITEVDREEEERCA